MPWAARSMAGTGGVLLVGSTGLSHAYPVCLQLWFPGVPASTMVQLLQSGFIAASAGAQHLNSKDIFSHTPVPVASSELIKPFPGGWGFALANTSAGDLFCWGVNQPTITGLKQGSEDGGSDPNQLEKVSDGVTTAAAGFDHGLAVKAGKLLTFGPSVKAPQDVPAGVLFLAPVQLKVPVLAVAAGEHHSLLAAENGSVWAFGSNREGQLGDPSVSGEVTSAVLVLGPGSHSRDGGALQPAVALAAGSRHSVVLNTLGQCYAWGWSLYGQCGTGRSLPSVGSPTLVKDLGPLKCTSVGAGLGHTVVSTDQGDVYAWGMNSEGQLGDGGDTASLQPKLVESPLLDSEEVTQVACGARHTLALTSSGRALAWGHNQFGALGVGGFAPQRAPALVAVPEGRRVMDLAAGWWHSLFLLE